ncbi:hypothetical protein SAMN04490357_0032 [Streptomyces misionensis]|uniref:Uncharacterized protein n=1 Tax=Streptomyces misionensis TaxID=67331 RepID=A0A1H4I6Y7_9ACTN|nr:hypothetical protein [Streptomyces misionensis]SEB29847.1 hypothetical protein SAMN04490357_0032 [Streptomyces misionensis]
MRTPTGICPRPPRPAVWLPTTPRWARTGAHLIRSSYTAGLAHADAPLLRGALENFATGLWLLDGQGA